VPASRAGVAPGPEKRSAVLEPADRRVVSGSPAPSLGPRLDRSTSLSGRHRSPTRRPCDQLVGFAYGHLIQTLIRPCHWARLASMAVDPDHGRRGIGSAWVAAIARFARDAGAESIEPNSERRREGAPRFCEALGYSNTDFSVSYAKPL